MRPKTIVYITGALSCSALVLSALSFWLSTLGNTVDTSNYIGNVPQWLTALIAFGAFVAAAISIRSQREIARKRAAFDFFTKTEMDANTLEAHKKYTSAVRALHVALGHGVPVAKFIVDEKERYEEIRTYLNLHELMSVGINRDVLDDHVCYYFWSGELGRCHDSTRKLIDYVQSMPNEQATYCEMIRVAERWKRRGLRRRYPSV